MIQNQDESEPLLAKGTYGSIEPSPLPGPSEWTLYGDGTGKKRSEWCDRLSKGKGDMCNSVASLKVGLLGRMSREELCVSFKAKNILSNFEVFIQAYFFKV